MKGTTIRLGFSGNFLNFLKRNGVALAFAAIVLGGFIFGVLNFFTDNLILRKTIDYCFDSYLKTRVFGSAAKIFALSAAGSVLFIIISFLSGLSLGGIPVLALLAFIKGFSLGMLGSMFSSSFAFKGFAFYLSITLIPGLISAFSLVLAGRESCSFSAFMLKSMAVGCKGGLMKDFRIYCVRYLVILAITLSSALADMLLSRFFAGSFGIL